MFYVVLLGNASYKFSIDGYHVNPVLGHHISHICMNDSYGSDSFL